MSCVETAVGENESTLIISERDTVLSGDSLPDSSPPTRFEEAIEEAETELTLLTAVEEPDRDIEMELTLLAVLDIAGGTGKGLPCKCPQPRRRYGKPGPAMIETVAEC